MNKLLLAGLASATAVAAAPAHAHPTYHYSGGCRSFTISDGTDSPQTSWDGEIHIGALATDSVTGAPSPTTSITVECELRINGAVPGTIVLSASGTGVAVGADQFSYNADPDDVVTMCDNVTVGDDFHKDCGDTTAMPMVPEPVEDFLEETNHTIDGELCDYLASLAGTYGPIEIRPDGDVFFNGERTHDCPPYDFGHPDDIVVIEDPVVGSITLFSTGGRPQVALGGAFLLPGWDCTDPEVAANGRLGVRCDWQGLVGTSGPECKWGSALAVLVPPFTVDNFAARTTTTCMGNFLAEWVQTDVSTGGPEFAHRDLEPQNASVVFCDVDDADGGAPSRFFADCTVRLW